MRGYTAFAADHDLETAELVLERFYEAVASAVTRFEGTLLLFHGGSASAVWNATEDQSDHELRGARAAWEMATTSTDLGGMTAAVGAATGSAMVGWYGSTRRQTFGVIGPPASGADRLAGFRPAARWSSTSPPLWAPVPASRRSR